MTEKANGSWKHLAVAALVLALCFVLCSCAKKSGLVGKYITVDPPVESGEMVTETIAFEGGRVTMTSGKTSQTVDYEIRDDRLRLKTRFGDFEYDYKKLDDGTLVIDGVKYRPE